MSEFEQRVSALAEHLDYSVEEFEPNAFDDRVIDHGSAEYLVLTDAEADEAANEDIRQSLWAFNADWLESWLRIPAKAIQAIQNEMYEDASEVFEQMLGDDFDDFASESISADGRGHFLSGYDGHELELGGNLYAYRIN